jgi:hypothetical protein
MIWTRLGWTSWFPWTASHRKVLQLEEHLQIWKITALMETRRYFHLESWTSLGHWPHAILPQVRRISSPCFITWWAMQNSKILFATLHHVTSMIVSCRQVICKNDESLWSPWNDFLHLHEEENVDWKLVHVRGFDSGNMVAMYLAHKLNPLDFH